MPRTFSSETQRAYTLRISSIDHSDNWSDALWATHEAVNKGAKAFGDWLLTLRGGIDHTLVNAKKPEKQKAQRILMALSWLSVESKIGAPAKYIVASGDEPAEERRKKVLAAFEKILTSRGLAANEIKEWKDDCSTSLSANIRTDAVWVNRSAAFDDAQKELSITSREEVWDLLGRFFNRKKYLTPESVPSQEEADEQKQENKEKDLVQKAGGWLSERFGTGKGADFGSIASVYEKIAEWAENKDVPVNVSGEDAIKDLSRYLRNYYPALEADNIEGVLKLISGPGHKSTTRNFLKKLADKKLVTHEDITTLAEKAREDAITANSNKGVKGQRAYANRILRDVERSCDFTYRGDTNECDTSATSRSKGSGHGAARHRQFAVMLDHAARRVSQVHTWIKRAEAERCTFEQKIEKIAKVPSIAQKWLDRYCEERSHASGASEEYRIRTRAIAGWEKVVAAWSSSWCTTSSDRIAAVRAMQDEPDLDKLGDIQLFEALAQDDARCVWHRDGDPAKEPDQQPLLDYVAATEAIFKKRQFKVPAYRHPDALLHPVFCDYGNSRWEVRFSVHEAPKNLEKLKKQNTRIEEDISRLKEHIQTVAQRTANSSTAHERLAKLQESLENKQKCLTSNKQKMLQLSDHHRFSLQLWTGTGFEDVPLRWHSKRMERDLAAHLDQSGHAHAAIVTRADRLGRAARGVDSQTPVTIEGLLEQGHWNGRLQVPRAQLNTLARWVNKHGWDEKAARMRRRIQWFLTFSAKLRSYGPWNEYAQQQKIPSTSWPHREENSKRSGSRAKLMLSRLPSLRVLSVDLGHRYAAACAVWETVDAARVAEVCRQAHHRPPRPEDLYLHLRQNGRTIIYRRIGADTLTDNTPHPAPWARLDRQFLIKLQGEDREPREASNQEIMMVHQLETDLGRTEPLIDRLVRAGWGTTEPQKVRVQALTNNGWRPMSSNASSAPDADTEDSDAYRPSLAVDQLMARAVRIVRLALQRHSDRAHIAHYLITSEKIYPGGIKEKLDDESRRGLIVNALKRWYRLCNGQGWRDDTARQLWDEYIASLPGYQASEEENPDHSDTPRSAHHGDQPDRFRRIAEALIPDAERRNKLHRLWKERWERDDQRLQQWIRRLKDWIFPRGKRGGDPAIRSVGGLSLTRLATITEFRRKIQIGFHTRLHPDGTRIETKEQYGQKTLEALERLREQRVKQLASRIVEAALGIGSEARHHWDGKKRARRRINDPRFAPCHAIVVENLTQYRPEETRTRRENRQLMTWSSAQVKKYLTEECQLYGIHFREVSASYTSLQDSRTGAPGVRCQDVPVAEFMQSPFWRRQVAQAERNQREGTQGDARERFLCDLNSRWKDASREDWQKAESVRIPLNGGEIFVSADCRSPAVQGMQADLNAAANIGLKALLDPDWPGAWWYVPCDPTTYQPVRDKVAGSTAVDHTVVLKTSSAGALEDPRRSARKKTKTTTSSGVINLWRDVSTRPLTSGEAWQEYLPYWRDVQARVVAILRRRAELDRETADR